MRRPRRLTEQEVIAASQKSEGVRGPFPPLAKGKNFRRCRFFRISIAEGAVAKW